MNQLEIACYMNKPTKVAQQVDQAKTAQEMQTFWSAMQTFDTTVQGLPFPPEVKQKIDVAFKAFNQAVSLAMTEYQSTMMQQLQSQTQALTQPTA